MIIIGIDPGYDRTGVAILQKEKGKESLVFSSLISTDKKKSHAVRLFTISTELRKIFKKYTPDFLVIEKIFFTKSTTTALGVAEARGVVLTLAGEYDVEVIEVTPSQVKIATTGYGRAEKGAIALMVPRIIKLPERKMIDDEMDAIAIALTGSPLTRQRK